jgi:hypothetical protein
MLIKFGWGEDITPDEMPYRVVSYSIEGAAEGGIDLLGNLEPIRIEMKIAIAPESAGNGVRMWDHGRAQHGSVSEEGKGRIVVFRGEGVGQSVLEIAFQGAWIASIDQSASASEDVTILDVVIAAARVQMTAGDDGSDLILVNHRRYSQVMGTD